MTNVTDRMDVTGARATRPYRNTAHRPVRADGIRPWLTRAALLLAALALFQLAVASEEGGPPTLATGSSAPDFCLPGVDGKTHCLKDYASAKVLAVIFTCNHCPTAQLYETRIKKLVADYQDRGVAFVAINPNNPEAIRLDELGYTDLSDSFEEMKIRADYRHFNFPYLFDGETQTVSRAYGPVATPHVFIFDSARKLRYDGRVDNNPREAYVTRLDARIALDEVLEGKPVEKPHTGAVGCSTKWIYKETTREEAIRKIEAQPVTVKAVAGDDLKALRRNSTGKVLLVDFWATWCGPCLEEMPDFETMFRMYGHRKFDFVTVSINYPDEKDGVLRALNQQHATTTNLLFGSTKIYDLMAAFDPSWNAAVPYTVLLSPAGEVLYKRQGPADALELRRLIVANAPDDDYKGLEAYWRQAVYPDEKATGAGQK